MPHPWHPRSLRALSACTAAGSSSPGGGVMSSAAPSAVTVASDRRRSEGRSTPSRSGGSSTPPVTRTSGSATTTGSPAPRTRMASPLRARDGRGPSALVHEPDDVRGAMSERRERCRSRDPAVPYQRIDLRLPSAGLLTGCSTDGPGNPGIEPICRNDERLRNVRFAADPEWRRFGPTSAIAL